MIKDYNKLFQLTLKRNCVIASKKPSDYQMSYASKNTSLAYRTELHYLGGIVST